MNLQEIELRLAAIKTEVEADGADLNALETEIKTLTEERKALKDAVEQRTKLLSDITAGVEGEVVKEFKEERKLEKILTPDSPEYRVMFLKGLQGNLNEIEKREWSSAVGSAGAVIPTVTSNMIFDLMTKIAPMLNEITLLRVAGNLRFAVDGAHAAAGIHVENAAVIPAADTMTFVTLGAFEFIKVQRVSATVRTMAIDAFEQWIVKALAEDLAIQLESEIILGTNVTGGVEDANVWADTVNGIDYGLAVTYDDLVELIALLPARNDRTAKFLMNKAMYYNQIAKIQDANGNPIAIPDFANGAQMRILGYPVIISDVVGRKRISW